MSSSDKVRDFEEYFQQVAAKVKDISGLNLSSDKYDSVFYEEPAYDKFAE